MKKAFVLLAALMAVSFGAQATAKNQGTIAAGNCFCSNKMFCEGPKGGKFCIQPNGKKKYL